MKTPRRFEVLAADFDGTLASEGRVAPDVVDAIERWRASGRLFVLVTGRQLEDLFAHFPRPDVCDAVVAENGALLHDPARGDTCLLGAAPDEEFLAALRARGVPFDVGRVVVATREPHGAAVRDVVRALGAPRHVISNEGAVMLLPREVDKGSGLEAALRDLGRTKAETVAIGNAENDLELLRGAGLAVAARNAVAELAAVADEVTRGEDGAGVVEVIERLLGDGS